MAESQLLLLRPDPEDKWGLLAPSVGGGRVPTQMVWPPARDGLPNWHQPPPIGPYLVLRTEDGTVDPIGMARAREVLARVAGFRFCARCREAEGDCHCAHLGDCPEWDTHIRLPGGATWRLPDEVDPDALARTLADRAGYSVIRGR